MAVAPDLEALTIYSAIPRKQRIYFSWLPIQSVLEECVGGKETRVTNFSLSLLGSVMGQGTASGSLKPSFPKYHTHMWLLASILIRSAGEIKLVKVCWMELIYFWFSWFRLLSSRGRATSFLRTIKNNMNDNTLVILFSIVMSHSFIPGYYSAWQCFPWIHENTSWFFI